MNLTSLITDNITEILVRIIEFTQARQKILTQNIINVHNLNFVPKELEVKEFSSLLSNAVDEYIKNERLLLQDTENIKFGTGCSFQAKPIIAPSSGPTQGVQPAAKAMPTTPERMKPGA